MDDIFNILIKKRSLNSSDEEHAQLKEWLSEDNRHETVRNQFLHVWDLHDEQIEKVKEDTWQMLLQNIQFAEKARPSHHLLPIALENWRGEIRRAALFIIVTILFSLAFFFLTAKKTNSKTLTKPFAFVESIKYLNEQGLLKKHIGFDVDNWQNSSLVIKDDDIQYNLLPNDIIEICFYRRLVDFLRSDEYNNHNSVYL